VEARWSPTTGERLVIKGAENDIPLTRLSPSVRTYLKEYEPHTYAGIALLTAIKKAAGGRPTGTSTWTQDTFHTRYLGAVADAIKRYGTPATNEHIAKMFPMSESTFYRCLRAFGRPTLT
jgi:hypothetical protein